MKYIYILLFVFLFSCTHKNSNNRLLDNFKKELKLEYQLKEIRNKELHGGLEILNLYNPMITGPFLFQANKVHARTELTLTQLLDNKQNSDSLIIVLNTYLNWVNSTFNGHGFIYEQIKIIKSQISTIKQHHSLTTNEIEYYFTKLSVELLDLEFELTRFIKSQIHENDFKFNKLEPVLVLDKAITKKGDEFTARILLAAVDTTHANFIYINHHSDSILLEVLDGAGIYRSIHKKNGINKISGFYNYRTEYGRILKYPFNFEYYVN